MPETRNHLSVMGIEAAFGDRKPFHTPDMDRFGHPLQVMFANPNYG